MGVEKYNQTELAQKFIQVEVYVTYMHANFVGIATPVLEILLLQIWPKFPFRTMDLCNKLAIISKDFKQQFVIFMCSYSTLHLSVKHKLIIVKMEAF